MKSPVPPRILGWMLRPRPSGLRRYVAGYGCVAAGVAAVTMIMMIFDRQASRCTADGFGCLGWIFRGQLVGGLVGLLIVIGGAIVTKLGLGYVLALLGTTVPIIVLGVLLSPLLPAALPLAVVILAGVPAGAARLTRPVAPAERGAVRDRSSARSAALITSHRRHLHALPR